MKKLNKCSKCKNCFYNIDEKCNVQNVVLSDFCFWYYPKTEKKLKEILKKKSQ